MDPVEVVEYDPAWPAQFDEIAARVRAAFLGAPLVSVEHVGSTSVEGLAAKPVIDLNVIVPTRADLPVAIARLATLGYVHEGDKGVPGREAFLWPPGTARHHLYACAEDNAEHKRHIAFRDYLRTRPDEARQYETLKRDLAARFRDNRLAYNDGKTDFVEATLARAQEEAMRT